MCDALEEIVNPDCIPDEEHEQQVQGMVTRHERVAKNCGGGQ